MIWQESFHIWFGSLVKVQSKIALRVTWLTHLKLQQTLLQLVQYKPTYGYNHRKSYIVEVQTQNNLVQSSRQSMIQFSYQKSYINGICEQRKSIAVWMLQFRVSSLPLIYATAEYKRGVFHHCWHNNQMALEPVKHMFKASLLIFTRAISLCEGDTVLASTAKQSPVVSCNESLLC